MNWKKALLIVVVLGFAFLLFVAAAIGITAVTAVAAIVEHGVVDTTVSSVAEAVDEVAREVERVEITVPRIGVREMDGLRDRVEVELDTPRITVTETDSGRSRVIVPNLSLGERRIVFDGSRHHLFWSNQFLAPLASLLRGLVTLVALSLVAVGAWLLLKNRRPAEKKIDTV